MSDDEDIEHDEFNLKLANGTIDRVGPLLAHELSRLPYTAQLLTMGSLVEEWLNALGDQRDGALDELYNYARGYPDGKAKK